MCGHLAPPRGGNFGAILGFAYELLYVKSVLFLSVFVSNRVENFEFRGWTTHWGRFLGFRLFSQFFGGKIKNGVLSGVVFRNMLKLLFAFSWMGGLQRAAAERSKGVGGAS